MKSRISPPQQSEKSTSSHFNTETSSLLSNNNTFKGNSSQTNETRQLVQMIQNQHSRINSFADNRPIAIAQAKLKKNLTRKTFGKSGLSNQNILSQQKVDEKESVKNKERLEIEASNKHKVVPSNTNNHFHLTQRKSANEAMGGLTKTEKKSDYKIKMNEEELEINPLIYDFPTQEANSLKEANKIISDGLEKIGNKIPHSLIAQEAIQVQGNGDYENYSAKPEDKVFPFGVHISTDIKQPTEAEQEAIKKRTIEIIMANSAYGYTTGVEDENTNSSHKWKMDKENDQEQKKYSATHDNQIEVLEKSDRSEQAQDGLKENTTPQEADAITKVISEGARYEAVKRKALIGNLQDDSLFYIKVGKFLKGCTFKELWSNWKKVFDREWNISEEKLAQKIAQNKIGDKKIHKRKPLPQDYELEQGETKESDKNLQDMVKHILVPSIDVIKEEDIDTNFQLVKEQIDDNGLGNTSYTTRNDDEGKSTGLIKVNPEEHSSKGAELATLYHELYLHYYHGGQGEKGADHSDYFKKHLARGEHTQLLEEEYKEKAIAVFHQLEFFNSEKEGQNLAEIPDMKGIHPIDFILSIANDITSHFLFALENQEAINELEVLSKKIDLGLDQTLEYALNFYEENYSDRINDFIKKNGINRGDFEKLAKKINQNYSIFSHEKIYYHYKGLTIASLETLEQLIDKYGKKNTAHAENLGKSQKSIKEVKDLIINVNKEAASVESAKILLKEKATQKGEKKLGEQKGKKKRSPTQKNVKFSKSEVISFKDESGITWEKHEQSDMYFSPLKKSIWFNNEQKLSFVRDNKNDTYDFKEI